MATHEFDLIDGLSIGDGDAKIVHKRVKLRTLTAGDLEDAALASEQMMRVGGEAVLVMSPARMANAILKAQILKIGDINGPLQDVFFRRLSSMDLELLQAEADELDSASRVAVEAALTRGRSAESA